MCGITGIIGKNDIKLAEKMNQLQSYRGPDDSGIYSDEENRVVLSMRRLSILDIRGGKQPMSNEDEKIWVVFNGEIFNSRSLRRQLSAGDHQFKSSHSDTEVLIHLYEEKGIDMLSQLSGMFAFVIYDKNRNLLFGARDRMGIKPLYYVYKNDIFSFSSELKPLLLLGEVSRNIDFQSLYNYMTLQFIPSPNTIFEDVRKIPAAHYFIFDINTKALKTCKYWDLPESSNKKLKVEDAACLIRQEVERAALDWTLSDVPIACSLSGGIDSSGLAGLLCKSGEVSLTTYSLGFRDGRESAFDERELARKTAQRWGTQHHEIILQPDDLLEDLEKMVWHLDEPYGGGLPSWYVFRAMKDNVRVALTGMGGDELFGNYGRWKPYEGFFWHLRNIAKLIFLDKSPLDTFSMLDKYPQGYRYYRYFTDVMKRKNLFRKEIVSRVEPTEHFIQQLWGQVKDRSPRDIVAYIDFKTQLPEEFLHMTDRFSMAHSVEARVPFLDHRLVELVMKMPARLRSHTRPLKYIFIKSIKDVLIEEVVRGPKKGFVLPVDEWLRGPLRNKVEYYLGEDYIKKQGLFAGKFYDDIVKPYLAGRKYLMYFIWTVFMFQLWYNRFVENN